MLLLIVLVHVAHIYDPTANWIVSSPYKTGLAPILSAIPVFSMPGFFMISSILSIFLLRKRSYQDWAKGRLLRIAIPLITGILILNPITIYFASAAMGIGAAGETSSPFTGDLATDFSVIDRRWVGHLWFLVTLGLFTIIAWYGFAKGVLMDWLNATSRFLVALDKKISLWWATVFAISVWSFGVKAAFYLLKTWLGFEPAIIAVLNIDTLFSYFPIFLLGMLLGVSEDLRAILFKVPPLRTSLLLIVYAAYILGAAVEIRELSLLRRFVSAGLGTGIALFLFGYHYPIANLLGYAFVFVAWNATFEFIIAIALTYGLSFFAAWLVNQSKYSKFVVNGEPFWKAPKASPETQLASN